MGAKELMISDWVMFNGSYYQIEEISQKGWVHLTNKSARVNMTTDYLLEVLQPIPLTSEILKANGFIRDGGASYWHKGKHTAVIIHWNAKMQELMIGNHKEDGMFRANVKYLHQLQHAFTYCEIDKDFKVDI